MARVRVITSVTGGTLPQRLRIRWAALRLRLAARNLTEYEVTVLFNCLIAEAKSRGLDVHFWGTVR